MNTVELPQDAVEGLGDELGRGARFVVYEAFLADGTRAAAKTVADARQQSVFVIERDLTRECDILSLLDHPNIPRAYGLWRSPHNNQLHLIMEIADGRRLETVIDICGEKRSYHGARHWDTPTKEIVRQVGEALAHVHSMGVHHNDLKPDNVHVHLNAEGHIHVTLIDFDSSGENSERGRFEYAAPERIDGHKASAQTDIYSFGVLVYKLITGTLPYRQSTVGESRSARETPPDMSSAYVENQAWNYLKAQDASMAATIKQTLRPSPKDRPADMYALLDKLGLGVPKRSNNYSYIIAATIGMGLAALIAFPQSDSLLLRRLLDRHSIAFCMESLSNLSTRVCNELSPGDIPSCFKGMSYLDSPAECTVRVKDLADCIDAEHPSEGN